MKKILFISHFFPPTGGSGVQRSTKFVKHLPALGFEPIVISSRIDNKNKWTPTDSSLGSDIPKTTQIHRLPDNKEFAVPNNFAENPTRTKGIVKLGSSVILKEKIELIYVSLSPFGDLSPAISLSEKFNIPLVADLRDPWALDEFQSQRSFYHRRKEIVKMGEQIKKCSHVIMNTPEAAKKTIKAFPDIDPSKVSWITNGFDRDDFTRPLSYPNLLPADRFNIVHTGTFHSDYAKRQKKEKLTNSILRRRVSGMDVSGRTPIYLLNAIHQLREKQSNLFEKLNVVFAGVISKQDQELIKHYNLSKIVKKTEYVTHSHCIEYTRSCQMLFLPLHGLKHDHRCSIVPGKTYEYLASEAIILAATPPGDTEDFVRRRGRCYICPPTDSKSIYKALFSSISQWSAKADLPPIDTDFVNLFSREKLSSDLAEVFRNTTSF